MDENIAHLVHSAYSIITAPYFLWLVGFCIAVAVASTLVVRLDNDRFWKQAAKRQAEDRMATLASLDDISHMSVTTVAFDSKRKINRYNSGM